MFAAVSFHFLLFYLLVVKLAFRFELLFNCFVLLNFFTLMCCINSLINDKTVFRILEFYSIYIHTESSLRRLADLY